VGRVGFPNYSILCAQNLEHTDGTACSAESSESLSRRPPACSPSSLRVRTSTCSLPREHARPAPVGTVLRRSVLRLSVLLPTETATTAVSITSFMRRAIRVIGMQAFICSHPHLPAGCDRLKNSRDLREGEPDVKRRACGWSFAGRFCREPIAPPAIGVAAGKCVPKSEFGHEVEMISSAALCLSVHLESLSL
jgi:hypothetical protein